MTTFASASARAFLHRAPSSSSSPSTSSRPSSRSVGPRAARRARSVVVLASEDDGRAGKKTWSDRDARAREPSAAQKLKEAQLAASAAIRELEEAQAIFDEEQAAAKKAFDERGGEDEDFDADADAEEEDDDEEGPKQAIPNSEFEPNMAAPFDAANAIIWDLDGTLADTTTLGFTSTNAVLAEAGHAEVTLEEYRRGTRYATPQRMALHARGDVDHEDGIELARRFDEMYVKLVTTDTAGFFPDVFEVVEALHKRGVNQGVLSNACTEYAREVMIVNGASKMMRAISGADAVPEVKPSPKELLQVAEKCYSHPRLCCYVGDSPSDGVAASAAGMMSVGVPWGSHSREELEGSFDKVVDDPKQLMRLLLPVDAPIRGWSHRK